MKIKITIATLFLLLLVAGCTYSFSHEAEQDIPKLKSDAEKLFSSAARWESKNIPDSAFFYYNLSQRTYLQINDRKAAANSLLKMAEIQLKAGDYPGSESTAMSALEIYRNKGDVIFVSSIYKHLAIANKKLSNYDRAIDYCDEAKKIETNDLENLKIESLLGRLYTAKNKYKEAISLLEHAQASPVIENDPLTKATLLDRKGYAYYKLDGNSGLSDMIAALNVRQKFSNLDDITLSFLHLSEYYGGVDIDNARLYALKAYATAWQSSNNRRKLQCLLRLVAVNNGKDANMYSQHYASLKNETDMQAQAVETKFKKMLDATDPELMSYEDTLKLEISKDNNRILFLALVASVFSSVLLFYQLTQRHKRERLLHAYAAETRLSKKIHDEIANELYGTLHYIENEDVVSGSKKEKLIEQLDNIYLMTRNISRENNDIDTGLRFPVQLKLMLAAYANNNVNVIVKGIAKINWDKVESTKKIATYRVLQELMVNMSKHSKATVVLIDFNTDKNKVKIIYSDNGVGSGCPKLSLKNGLKNVENRMVSIGGSISFDTQPEKGFHLTLTYPLPLLYV